MQRFLGPGRCVSRMLVVRVRTRKRAISNLDVFDHRFIVEVPLRGVPASREGVWGDVEEGAVAGVYDG